MTHRLELTSHISGNKMERNKKTPLGSEWKDGGTMA